MKAYGHKRVKSCCPGHDILVNGFATGTERIERPSAVLGPKERGGAMKLFVQTEGLNAEGVYCESATCVDPIKDAAYIRALFEDYLEAFIRSPKDAKFNSSACDIREHDGRD